MRSRERREAERRGGTSDSLLDGSGTARVSKVQLRQIPLLLLVSIINQRERSEENVYHASCALVYWLNLANDIEYDTLTPVARYDRAARSKYAVFSDPFGAVSRLK